MYIRNACYDWFMLNVALSFGTTVMPLSSSLAVVIKVTINLVNSSSCIVRELHGLTGG